MCLLSIIVPVYNGEQYISSCISSIRNQNISNYEIIFVNDGSTDNSLDIIKYYAVQDKSIKLISTPNKGVSHARNIGLGYSVGQYITFLDCDDTLVINAYKIMLEKAMTVNADIVCCATEHRFARHSVYKFIIGNDSELSRSDAVIKYLGGGIINISACSKVYRKSVVENIKFDERIKINEDKLFIYQVLLNSERIYCINVALYIYNQINNSVSHSNPDIRWLDMKVVADRMLELTKNKAKYAIKEANVNCFYTYQHLYRIMSRTKSFRLSHSSHYKDLKKDIKKMYNLISDSISHKYKIEYFLSKNEVLYKFILGCIGIVKRLKY